MYDIKIINRELFSLLGLLLIKFLGAYKILEILVV